MECYSNLNELWFPIASDSLTSSFTFLIDIVQILSIGCTILLSLIFHMSIGKFILIILHSSVIALYSLIALLGAMLTGYYWWSLMPKNNRQFLHKNLPYKHQN